MGKRSLLKLLLLDVIKLARLKQRELCESLKEEFGAWSKLGVNIHR